MVPLLKTVQTIILTIVKVVAFIFTLLTLAAVTIAAQFKKGKDQMPEFMATTKQQAQALFAQNQAKAQEKWQEYFPEAQAQAPAVSVPPPPVIALPPPPPAG